MIRTVIAEHTALVRAGLVAFLRDQDDIDVVAELQRGEQVVPVSRAVLPDVAVLDAALPGQDGFSAAAALHAGGFIVQDAPQEFITDAVRQVSKGTKVIDPELAFAALNAQQNPLTERELDALRFAARGVSTAEIASHLSLSIGTVRNYLSRAITKTGARNRVDLIRISDNAGWLDQVSLQARRTPGSR